ncbi:hypothetical protein FAM09_04075 [Niastella caeni]|uniref:LiaF transmembrane domain-containing protein n=1 Tax=Niastella caeni TaxID=2569763 RepID=A0A4S8I353_9BACT|nr:DUF5668 domain-containing protein [Niastella caeni]THU41294.1 hypothetical protein FAM09_04075 [Niastella caeni]
MRDKTIKEQRKAYRKERRKELMRRRNRSGSVLAGLLLLCIGSIFLLKEFGVPFPGWLFTWPMILVGFGLLAGAGNSFRDPGWVVITGIGAVFLLDEIWPKVPIHHFIWPVVIIALGLIIMLAPRRHRKWHEKWNQWNGMQGDQYKQNIPNVYDVPDPTIPETMINPAAESNKKNSDSWLEVVTIFGSVKKLVYSKNFKGGEIISIFGGAEINLSHADFNGPISIELVQIFGSTKLIVPPHWQIRSQVVAVFGGIEDKRPPQSNYDEDKVIVLNGTTFFGGIDIKSY